jgi:methyl-accepting chemotaxis protein
MKNMRIAYKILMSLSLIISMIGILGAFTFNRVGAMDQIAEEIRTNWMVSIGILGELQGDTSSYRITQARWLMTEDVTERDNAAKRGELFEQRVQNDFEKYRPTIASADERRQFDVLVEEWRSYLALSQKSLEQAKSGDRSSAITAFNTTLQVQFRKATSELEALVKLNSEGAADAGARSKSAFEMTKLVIGLVLAVSVILAIAAGSFLHGSITVAVRRMTGVMQKLATGDYAITIPDTDRTDEIGQMATSVLVFKDGLVTSQRLAQEKQALDAAEAQKRIQMEQLTKEFVDQIDGIVNIVAAAATELRGNSSSLSSTAEESARQTTSAAAAADQASSNVQTVAAATEELNVSIAEISRQVSQAAGVADQAVSEAQATSLTMAKLSSSAEEIGAVVALINSIAAQTNLLALNATIEAARAGDAGKGFAVVAAEVKNLASQTAKATGDIHAYISSIQEETVRAVAAIDRIGNTIKSINGTTIQVAAAVEQQDAATREIARNVQEAAVGTHEVSQAFGSVTRAANDTGEGAGMVRMSADELAKQAETLRGHVDQFVATVKAA